MRDLIFIVTTVGFFFISLGYLLVCDALKGDRQ